jgi:magnesium transporter
MEQRVDTIHVREQLLQQVTELLRAHKLAAEETTGDGRPPRDRVKDLVHRRELDALQHELDRLHPADVAYILEALPLDERLIVWDLVKAERDGEILLEVSDAVRATLIANMDEDELVAATEQLDTDEIADLAPDLPREVIQDVFKSLSVEEREQLRAAMSYAESSVGALMDFDMVEIREDVTLEVVLRYLRRLDEMPDHTDQLFVVDRAAQLKGLLPVNRLLVSPPESGVSEVMIRDFVQFNPSENAQDAAAAFERYDLVSAPVVDDDGRLVGRISSPPSSLHASSAFSSIRSHSSSRWPRLCR